VTFDVDVTTITTEDSRRDDNDSDARRGGPLTPTPGQEVLAGPGRLSAGRRWCHPLPSRGTRSSPG
jgi:hypothetical protein